MTCFVLSIDLPVDKDHAAAMLRTEIDAICSVQHQFVHWAQICKVVLGPSPILFYARCDMTLDDLLHSDDRLSWADKQRIVRELAEALNCVATLLNSGATWLAWGSFCPVDLDVILISNGHVKLAPEVRTVRESIEHGERMSDALPRFAPLMRMAPELLRGKRANEAAAVYSFGVIVWQVATQCSRPFPGEDVMRVAVKVAQGRRLPLPIADAPKVLSFVVDNATKFDPESRPSFKELFRWLSWRDVVCTVGFGLQSLELPALLTLAIVDEFDICELVPMHSKWNAICAIKHFRRQ